MWTGSQLLISWITGDDIDTVHVYMSSASLYGDFVYMRVAELTLQFGQVLIILNIFRPENIKHNILLQSYEKTCYSCNLKCENALFI